MAREDLPSQLASAAAQLRARSGRAATAAGIAPGRVNLIGEHTDYSEGWVLPCAIDRHTVVVGARRDDATVVVHALDLGATGSFDARRPARRGDWLDYVQGIFAAHAEAGFAPGGAELAIASRVPLGAGVSSSAALGVAVAAALARLFDFDTSPRDWAELAHRGESGFVGVGCGILDQFASALGRRGHALRIDCRARSVEPVAFAGEAPVLLLVHSGVTRSLAFEGAYRERVDACRAAFEAAQRAGLLAPGARTLRDLDADALPALERVLDAALFRRARHVVHENARVDAFADAMRTGDRAALRALLHAGQASLRDDYEGSTPELDALCALAAGEPAVIGSRLTGAGFGGCTLHLVERGEEARVARGLADGFAARFGRRPETLAVEIDDGAQSLDL